MATLEETLRSLGLSAARGIPQLATGFVDLAALPFTATGLLKPEQAVGSTAYLTSKGLLPPEQQGLLNQTAELVSSAINPAVATKAALAKGGLLMAAPSVMGSIKPISSKNITYDANKILVDIPVNQIMHGESIMPGGKLTFTGAKELIKEYANKKTDFPPIEIVSSDASIPWMVADGSHRLEAAKLRGDKTIKAYISPFDKEGLELIKKK